MLGSPRNLCPKAHWIHIRGRGRVWHREDPLGGTSCSRLKLFFQNEFHIMETRGNCSTVSVWSIHSSAAHTKPSRKQLRVISYDPGLVALWVLWKTPSLFLQLSKADVLFLNITYLCVTSICRVFPKIRPNPTIHSNASFGPGLILY